MQKKMEINSRIICLLANMGAPSWVRPSMLWDDKWLTSAYTSEQAVKEAEIKIRMFIPREEESA